MRIAHLSDIHIHSVFRPKNLLYTHRLIEYALKEGADHLVITGDLTHNAGAEDFKVLRRTFEKFDLLRADRLSLVIGNHDIYGGVFYAEDILDFPERCLTTDFTNKIKEFNYFFLETFDNVYRPDSERLYPYAKEISDCVLIGINSILKYSRVKNLFASKGKIKKRQFKGIKDILNKQEFQKKNKLMMIHHHFERIFSNDTRQKQTFLQNIEGKAMRLKGKQKLIDLFRESEVDLVLHGHSHESGEYWHKGLHFSAAGGSIDGNKPGQIKINFIDIMNNKFEIDIRTLSVQKRNLESLNRSKTVVNSISYL
jgi:3',5'-cyclic AMP phosphodiesterase CpdA